VAYYFTVLFFGKFVKQLPLIRCFSTPFQKRVQRYAYFNNCKNYFEIFFQKNLLTQTGRSAHPEGGNCEPTPNTKVRPQAVRTFFPLAVAGG
jgi:hypothetical protein